MAVVDVALTILAIAAAVLLVTALAERLNFSAPLLLMLVGIGASFLSFITVPELTPELVLLGFLPPLLYATAIHTSLIDSPVSGSSGPTAAPGWPRCSRSRCSRCRRSSPTPTSRCARCRKTSSRRPTEWG